MCHQYLNVLPSGIADGVGGWRRYDVDPSKFTRSLMNNCERIARSTTTDVLNPVGLLQRAYEQMMHLKSPLLGKFLVYGGPTV